MNARLKSSLLGVSFAALVGCAAMQDVSIEGEPKVWHVQTLSFEGPDVSETRDTFTDYRLDVVFTHESEAQINVPGYFAADGNAKETSADKGNVWRVKFTPPKQGTWAYNATFVEGAKIALTPNIAGESAGYFDGAQGHLSITEPNLDVTATDFRKHGKLSYAGARYLKFEGTGKYFLKTGAGSPENLLAFDGFDNTYDAGGTHFPALGDTQLHTFAPHANDALSDAPTWQGGKGANLLGAVNYISEVGINGQYILLMNVEGDGQDVWPWTTHDDPYVFDVSKLAQWEQVFTHMDHRGILKNFLLTETENESWFEVTDETNVEFSDARKLYYREMVARFGHLLGVVWNLGEEQGVDGNSGNEIYRKATTLKQRLDFAKYISDLDPYDHPVVSHNWPDSEEETYGDKLGSPYFSGISLQAHHDYGQKIATWGERSSAAGRPWIITVDEPLGWEYGARPDTDADTRSKEITEVLLPTLVSGGAGVSWYFGWQNNAPTSDLSNEDMRSRHKLWVKSADLRRWWEKNVPFYDMKWQNGGLVHTDIPAQPEGTIIKISMTKDGLMKVTRKEASGSDAMRKESLLDPMSLEHR